MLKLKSYGWKSSACQEEEPYHISWISHIHILVVLPLEVPYLAVHASQSTC